MLWFWAIKKIRQGAESLPPAGGEILPSSYLPVYALTLSSSGACVKGYTNNWLHPWVARDFDHVQSPTATTLPMAMALRGGWRQFSQTIWAVWEKCKATQAMEQAVLWLVRVEVKIEVTSGLQTLKFGMLRSVWLQFMPTSCDQNLKVSSRQIHNFSVTPRSNLVSWL